MINLTKRLYAVANFAKDGKVIADIGTDHGYIPVYLIQLGTAQKIIASDIGEGPLNRAVASAREYGVEDRIVFSRADGLSGVDRDVDTIIIAGMGGDNIISILDRDRWSLEGPHLVLQPQSRVQKLVLWLYSHGCYVDDAVLVRDFSRMYIVLSVKKSLIPGEITLAEAIAPRALFINRDPLLPDYLHQQVSKLRTMVKGAGSGRANMDEKLQNGRIALIGLERMIEEVEKW